MKDDGFWWRLVHLNPALFRAAVVGVFALLSALGVVLSPALPDALIGAVLPLAMLVQAVWTRAGVVPVDKVLAYQPDPVERPGVIASGAAAPPKTTRDATILDAVRHVPAQGD